MRKDIYVMSMMMVVNDEFHNRFMATSIPIFC